MEVAALLEADAWFSRMSREMRENKLDSQTLQDVPVLNTVLVETVYLDHDGPESNYRPFFVIQGRLLSSEPAIDLPFGVTKLSFSSDPVTIMKYRYDLTDEQIATMVVEKGLHTPEFKVPDTLTNIDWEMPGYSDLFIVSPFDMEAPPIVFCTIKDQTQHMTNYEDCEYNVVQYIPTVKGYTEEVTINELDTNAEVDLFADKSTDAEYEATPVTSADVRANMFGQDLTFDEEFETEESEPEVGLSEFDKLIAKARDARGMVEDVDELEDIDEFDEYGVEPEEYEGEEYTEETESLYDKIAAEINESTRVDDALGKLDELVERTKAKRVAVFDSVQDAQESAINEDTVKRVDIDRAVSREEIALLREQLGDSADVEQVLDAAEKRSRVLSRLKQNAPKPKPATGDELDFG